MATTAIKKAMRRRIVGVVAAVLERGVGRNGLRKLARWLMPMAGEKDDGRSWPAGQEKKSGRPDGVS